MHGSPLARRIDHTLLQPEATEPRIRALVAQAIEFHFAAVCVNPCWVDLVSVLLRQAGVHDPPTADCRVATCACVGFPFGVSLPATKAGEAAVCVRNGADEIDMVIFLPAVLAGDLDRARRDVLEVTRATRSLRSRTVVKVILETALLAEEHMALGCRAAREGGADFVKTSTGFHPAGGASVLAVQWLKKYSGGLRVKAAGGIRDWPTAQAMLAAGADRLGCSASVAIVTAAEKASASP
jgi:deoxyribose-phosphate aldolase